MPRPISRPPARRAVARAPEPELEPEVETRPMISAWAMALLGGGLMMLSLFAYLFTTLPMSASAMKATTGPNKVPDIAATKALIVVFQRYHSWEVVADGLYCVLGVVAVIAAAVVIASDSDGSRKTAMGAAFGAAVVRLIGGFLDYSFMSDAFESTQHYNSQMQGMAIDLGTVFIMGFTFVVCLFWVIAGFNIAAVDEREPA